MRPNDFSADQRSAQHAAGCTSATAATNVRTEIATLTMSRASKDRVLLRNGKKRSSRNNTSARTPTATIEATGVTLVFALVRHIAARCNSLRSARAETSLSESNPSKVDGRSLGGKSLHHRRSPRASLISWNAFVRRDANHGHGFVRRHER